MFLHRALGHLITFVLSYKKSGDTSVCRLFLMPRALAVTSSVLLVAAAAAALGLVLCVFSFRGLRYQIHCWTRALLPPLQLSSYTAVCLSGLSVLTDLSVCHFDPVCLFSGPLLLICLSVALSDLLAPGRWQRQHKLSLETSHPEDDSHEKLQMLIEGLNFKHSSLCETNNHCQRKIVIFPSFASLSWLFWWTCNSRYH